VPFCGHRDDVPSSALPGRSETALDHMSA
jgi:hypothetical protein